MIDWRPEELNETLRPIAEHIGVDVAQALVREFGGMRIHIPKVWSEQIFLNVLGEDVARQLIGQFAGEVVTVPRSLAMSAARIARAKAMRKAGATVNQIARALGISHRLAQLYLAGQMISFQPRKRRWMDDRQMDIEDLIGPRA